MLFESLLWHGFRGPAKLEDAELAAVVTNLPCTVTLSFAIDNDVVRKALGVEHESCCDGLFVSIRRIGKIEPEVSLLFLELKGKNIDHAIDQLENAIKAVQSLLAFERDIAFRGRTRFSAAIVTDLARPPLVQTRDRRRLQKLGAELDIRVAERRGKSANLTDLVWRRAGAE